MAEAFLYTNVRKIALTVLRALHCNMLACRRHACVVAAILSITYDTAKHSVLVTCRTAREMKEFSTDGQLLSQIALSVGSPWHTVQMPSGKLIFCHGHHANVKGRIHGAIVAAIVAAVVAATIAPCIRPITHLVRRR